ncbi:hypothetical protein PUN28_003838 [Cardiocondyla obscurior]|uniref:Uncharacterized protein n=1 Tax=Cardiocondyla obscurior TaxID=286306 RepID=A0AAW2GMB0_9HYME
MAVSCVPSEIDSNHFHRTRCSFAKSIRRCKQTTGPSGERNKEIAREISTNVTYIKPHAFLLPPVFARGHFRDLFIKRFRLASQGEEFKTLNNYCNFLLSARKKKIEYF